MIIIQNTKLSDLDECPYISGRDMRIEYFYALNLDDIDLNRFIEKGWRKFGMFYFLPNCPECLECVPIRIPIANFKSSKSQRRVLNKASEIKVRFGPLEYREEIYDIYRNHSENRFNKDTDFEEFMFNFYTKSCPALQSEYYLDDRLVAVGFLDKSSEGLSSVYFVYNTDFSKYRLGTFSIIKEIEYAASLGIKYYYIGYYIKDNQSMAYKGRFFPQELYDWRKDEWKEREGPEE